MRSYLLRFCIGLGLYLSSQLHAQTTKPASTLSDDFVALGKNGRIAGTIDRPHTINAVPGIVFVGGGRPSDRDGNVGTVAWRKSLCQSLASRGFATLRFDDPGRGGSDGNFDEYTLQDSAAAVDELAKYLRTKPYVDSKNVYLVGHSQGALVCTMAIQLEKDLAAGVILVSPTLEKGSLSVKRYYRKHLPIDDPFKTFTVVSELVDLAESSAAVRVDESDELEKRVRSTLTDMSRKVQDRVIEAQRTNYEYLFTNRTRSYLRYDPKPDLCKMRQPICIILGTADAIVPFDVSTAIVADIIRVRKRSQDDFYPLLGLNHALYKGNEWDLAHMTVPDDDAIDAIGSFIQALAK